MDNMEYDLNIFEQKNGVCANMIDKKQHNRQTKNFLKNHEGLTFAYIFGILSKLMVIFHSEDTHHHPISELILLVIIKPLMMWILQFM